MNLDPLEDNIRTFSYKHSPSVLWVLTSYGPRQEVSCLRGLRTRKAQNSLCDMRSLISVFVIHILECTVASLATCKISIFKLVLFESSFVGNPEDRFCRIEDHMVLTPIKY